MWWYRQNMVKESFVGLGFIESEQAPTKNRLNEPDTVPHPKSRCKKKRKAPAAYKRRSL